MEFKVGQIFATDEEKLSVAIAEAHLGLSEGGIPIGAALFDEHGALLGSGKIGFRQMKWTHFAYRNFKVWRCIKKG